MISDLQQRKASHYYDLIDEDDNGYVEARDFELRVDRLIESRGVSDEEAREALRDRVMGWWDHLYTLADIDDDERVTREEWDTYWHAIQAGIDEGGVDEAETLESLERAARGTFRAINTSGSGGITEEEYAEWLEAWGVHDSQAAFRRLDRDDTGTLSEDDLVEAVKEFYLSNDPDAPGNALYGELPETS